MSNLVLGRVKPACLFGKSKETLTLFRTGVFEAASDGGGMAQKDPPPSYILSQKSYNEETWHSYTLLIEDAKNI